MRTAQLYTQLRRKYRMFGILLSEPVLGPRVVSLEVTHICNLRCRFCASHGVLAGPSVTERRQYSGGRRAMALKTVRRLARDLGAAATELVELSGKGDPLAHPQCAEIVAAIRNAGPACALVTNGTLARESTAPALVHAGLDRLSVSLNAASRETYHLVAGSDLWDRAVGFISDVRSERDRRGTRAPWIRVTHVITRENAAEMAAMCALAVQFKVDEVGFSAMGEFPETLGLRVSAEQRAVIREQIPSWAARLDGAGIRHNLDAFGYEIAHRCAPHGLRENLLQRALPCYDPWTFSVIGPDGVVAPCCYCSDHHLGDTTEQSFHEIWHGEPYRRLRTASRNMPRTRVPLCRECYTSCNRASENFRIWSRLHPFRSVSLPRMEEAAARG